MTVRRAVRVTESFFEQLEVIFGATRGPNGEPSATDFLIIELPAIVERFAVDFDDLPELVEDLPGGRVLIATGLLVRAFAVYGLLITDGSVELIGITVEP